MSKKIIVDFNHVSAVLQGKKVLEDITFSIVEGTFTGVIGPNGAGKTTLLRLILGLLEPEQGNLKVFDENPVNLSGTKRKTGYLPQKPYFNRRFPVSALDVVLMGAIKNTGLFRLPGRKTKRLAEEIMAKLGILELKNRTIGELSGGQQQLVFLASALTSDPKLLILDEPTNGLDPAAQYKFYQLLKKMQSEMSLTIITVSHDLAAISANAGRLICINKTMHMHGSPAEVLNTMAHAQNYRCEFDLFFGSYGWRDRA